MANGYARKWSIDYAFRDEDGKYHEEHTVLEGSTIVEVLRKAEEMLGNLSADIGWKAWRIWNAGLLAGAEEEVC